MLQEWKSLEEQDTHPYAATMLYLSNTAATVSSQTSIAMWKHGFAAKFYPVPTWPKRICTRASGAECRRWEQ